MRTNVTNNILMKEDFHQGDLTNECSSLLQRRVALSTAPQGTTHLVIFIECDRHSLDCHQLTGVQVQTKIHLHDTQVRDPTTQASQTFPNAPTPRSSPFFQLI